jgi:two-component system sensor histidine kinase QseC
VYWSIIAVLALKQNLREVHELYDIHLSHTALALLRISEPDPKVSHHDPTETILQLFQKWPDLPQSVTPGHFQAAEAASKPLDSSVVVDEEAVRRNIQHGMNMRYQLWRNGDLVFRSANAPQSPMSNRIGFSFGTDEDGKAWRTYSIRDPSATLLAIVSERQDERNELVRGIAVLSTDPVILGMPLFILLIWLTVWRGLGPLTDLSRAIAKRDANSLVPLNDKGCPRELQPMVEALNNLIAQMKLSLEAERRFNSNAAHELNTPLAAIQAHLFVARHAQDEDTRQGALEQAHIATARGIRLVRQMLALARLGPHRLQEDFANFDLTEIAQNVCAELVPLALRRNQSLEINAPSESIFILGQADLMHQLLTNLVDNAMRYSPDGGRIVVELSQIDGRKRICVNDNGPGIPLEKRSQVFDRFIRLADESVSGTGLGLAICRKIAQLHNAEISLSSGPDDVGLQVQVDFPLSS